MIKKREPGRVGASEEGYYLLRKAQKSKTKETEKEWTYDKIAEQVGCSSDTVKRFFSGKEKVLTYTAKEIVKILDLDFSDVVDLSQSNIVNSQTKDSKTPSQQLKEALLDLNYIEQDYRFRISLTTMGTVGAFLIHGEEGYGQRWLLNRLACVIPYNSTAYQKSLDILYPKTLFDFWEDLGDKLNCSPTPEAIAEKLYQHWTTQTVILSITDIHKVDQGLESFLQQVWLKIIDKTNNYNPTNDFKMVLFIVGNQTFKSISNLLIDLQPIKAFKNEEIKRWGGAKLSDLLSEIKQYSTEQSQACITEIIKRNTPPSSQPEEKIPPFSTLIRICKSCNIQYADIEGTFTL
ncbi:hypothetical protein [Planktothrix pseudagardhii]|uniref:Inactive STAND domain-containing protein n=1 Tax=Planktothrix pseudagardhii TaxID=132604 RepID=A0A9W4D168_9CYAN|nr:hypothetical protein [Planktothrix pseudagardhii]CAD5949845.1 hypothetical protein NO713_02486 [Planktothrix pseudagardhii]